MCICMTACMPRCPYACMYASEFMWACLGGWLAVCMPVCVCMRVCVYVCVCVCVNVCMWLGVGPLHEHAERMQGVCVYMMGDNCLFVEGVFCALALMFSPSSTRSPLCSHIRYCSCFSYVRFSPPACIICIIVCCIVSSFAHCDCIIPRCVLSCFSSVHTLPRV